MASRFQKIKNLYHLFQAVIANVWYAFPSRKLKVIGVTGTDGKTTTTHLIYDIFKKAGKRVSMISTVYAKIGNREYETGLHTTTPDPFLVQSMLHKSLQNNDEYFILETTSHAMDQNRVWGVRYQIGVLTNVTHEHLDYHGDYREYLLTKTKLLKGSRVAVINKDDGSYETIRSLLTKQTVLTYSLTKNADFTFDFRRVLPGLADFNAYNYLAAYAAATSAGINKDVILSTAKTFSLPVGRLQTVYSGRFSVMVDFAHTPNAIKKLLETIKKNTVRQKGRIIHVFGSAGLRDVSKRPLMGAASAAYADVIILTEEDYRTEDPSEIARAIAKGVLKQGFRESTKNPGKNDKKIFSIVLDRRSAIETAIKAAAPGDIVVITGKGHEKSLCRGTTEYPWSDQGAISEILNL